MASTALLASVYDTVAGVKSATGTPQVGDLIIIIACHGGRWTSTPTDSEGGSYVEAARGLQDVNSEQLGIYVRTALITSAVSTTFTHDPTGGSGTNGGGLVVLRVAGMTRTGSAAVKQSQKADNQAAGTPALTFGGSANSANPVIGAVFNNSSPSGITPPASFTELADLAFVTPSSGFEVAVRDSGHSAAAMAWGSASPTGFTAVAVELDTSAASGGRRRQIVNG